MRNILSNGTNDQKKYLLTEHVFEAFCDALRNPRFLNEPGGDKELHVFLDGGFHFLKFAQADSKGNISSLFKKENKFLLERKNYTLHKPYLYQPSNTSTLPSTVKTDSYLLRDSISLRF